MFLIKNSSFHPHYTKPNLILFGDCEKDGIGCENLSH